MDEIAQDSLKQIQDNLDELDRQQYEEEMKILDKYFELKQEHYEERNKIIKKIPGFWGTAIKHHPVLGTLLEANDIKILKHMIDLKVEKPSRGHIRIIFEFETNAHFNDSKVIKEFKYDQYGKINVIKHPIHWKSGMNLLEPKPRKRKATTLSFFSWFTDDDHELGELIAEDLYPNAVKLYKGEEDNDE